MLKRNLTQEVKNKAIELGADLVGIAPVQRWEKAPIEHSPQGILPEAKSVIVCGIHFLDACTELAAEKDPRFPGTGLSEMNASGSLGFLGYQMAKFLQEKGWRTIPIIPTMLWNYRPQKGAPRGWMADMCHYYAAVAAGLGEIGWHNLCITPEYGTRQRFVSIITEAQLGPDPLYNGKPLCDKCLLCAKNCPTQSFDKEVSGMCSIEIEDKTYSFPNRNLWRCAIGENFQLDVFLPWPDKVDEKVITETMEKAVTEHPDWIHRWKMGMCLKYCVPPQRRYFDRKYCKSPRRRRDVIPVVNKETVRNLVKNLSDLAAKIELDFIGAASLADFEKRGIDLKKFLPDAESAIVIGEGYPENCEPSFFVNFAELRLGTVIQEGYGFSSLIHSDLSPEIAALTCGLATDDKGKIVTPQFAERQTWCTIITSAPLSRTSFRKEPIKQVSAAEFKPSDLTKKIKEIAHQAGADLIGIAPRERIAQVADCLEETFKNEEYFIVEDAGWKSGDRAFNKMLCAPFNPVVKKVKITPKRLEDYLPEAKSAIVIGLHLIEASIDCAGKPPAYKAGHYAYTTHWESPEQLYYILLKVAKFLNGLGYKVFPAVDLCGLASKVYGDRLDLTDSRFAAVAAGLGEIGWNGLVLTPQFGVRQRFTSLVTDAPLEYDSVYNGPALCKKCFKCVDSCSVGAIPKQEKYSLKISEKVFVWGKTDRLRCDCAKRYALVAEEGPGYIGSRNDFKLPEHITPEFICKAVENSDRIQRSSYCTIVEKCFTNCPGHLPESKKKIALMSY